MVEMAAEQAAGQHTLPPVEHAYAPHPTRAGLRWGAEMRKIG